MCHSQVKIPRTGKTRNKIPRPDSTRPDPIRKYSKKCFPRPGPVLVRSGPVRSGEIRISGCHVGLYLVQYHAPVLVVKVTLYSVYAYELLWKGTLSHGGVSMFLHRYRMSQNVLKRASSAGKRVVFLLTKIKAFTVNRPYMFVVRNFKKYELGTC